MNMLRKLWRWITNRFNPPKNQSDVYFPEDHLGI